MKNKICTHISDVIALKQYKNACKYRFLKSKKTDTVGFSCNAE